jgi:hypothetical protein
MLGLLMSSGFLLPVAANGAASATAGAPRPPHAMAFARVVAGAAGPALVTGLVTPLVLVFVVTYSLPLLKTLRRMTTLRNETDTLAAVLSLLADGLFIQDSQNCIDLMLFCFHFSDLSRFP